VRLTRLYVDLSLAAGALLALPAEAAAHVARVLRGRGGDAIVLFNGDGREFDAVIDTVRGARVEVAVTGVRSVDRESPLALTLLQCVPRGDRMDWIVQKATELGVARIVPLASERSLVRLDGKQAQSKAAHWRRVAAGACEQCGRNRLPVVESPQPLVAYLGAALASGSRLLLEPDGARGAWSWRGGAAIEIAIGPEGGFTREELEAFRITGFVGVRLGPRILRVETAAIAALTWLQTQFGDMAGAALAPATTP